MGVVGIRSGKRSDAPDSFRIVALGGAGIVVRSHECSLPNRHIPFHAHRKSQRTERPAPGLLRGGWAKIKHAGMSQALPLFKNTVSLTPAVSYRFAVCDNWSTNGLATEGVVAVPSTMSLFFRSLP